MGWLKKTFKKVGKKLKKFFKSDVGKAIGTIALAVAGFHLFGPATATAGQTTATAGQTTATAGQTAGAVSATGGAGATGAAAGTTTGMFGGTIGPTIRSSISNFFGGTGGTTGEVATGDIVKAEVAKDQTASEIAKNVMNNVNQNIATGGENIINPNLTDAVGQTIDANKVLSIQADPRTASRVAEGLGTADTTAAQSLQAEYSQRGLTNLADATQLEITAANPPQPSLLSPEMPVENFDTTFVDGPSQLGPSSETLAQRTSTAGSPTPPTPDPIPEADPLLNQGTKDFLVGVGAGTTTSLLTSAIMGPGEEPEGGAGNVEYYDKAEAPAGSYVADISRTYQQNGGMPLKFEMYQNGTVPMYGPSSPRGLANNPYLFAT